MTLRPPVSERDHFAGSFDAPLTLVEYGDYQCPYCAAADPVVRSVQAAFGRDLRFVFRNFPITEVHPEAEPAAELAEAAAELGKFWEMHDAIYAWSRAHGPESLGPRAFESIIATLGLDAAFLEAAMRDHRYLERIRSDFISGARSGVNGTPTFFVDGRRHDGEASVAELSAALLRAARGRDAVAPRR